MGGCKRLVLLFQFLEQSHVLDSDDGLVGEGLKESHLGISERAYLGSKNRYAAERLTLTQERNLCDAMDAVELEQLKGVGILARCYQLDVVDYDWGAIENCASAGEPASKGKRQADQPLHLCTGMRCIVEAFALQSFDDGITRLTEAHGTRGNGVQHWLQISWRLSNNPQHIGCGGLAVQCRRQVTVARLQLSKQPHVLYRDDRLIGEGVEQRYVCLRERLDFGTADQDDAERNTFTQKRYSQMGPDTVLEREHSSHWELVVVLNGHEIVDVDCRPVDHGPAADRSAHKRYRRRMRNLSEVRTRH